jgi:hypothetical protein
VAAGMLESLVQSKVLAARRFFGVETRPSNAAFLLGLLIFVFGFRSFFGFLLRLLFLLLVEWILGRDVPRALGKQLQLFLGHAEISQGDGFVFWFIHGVITVSPLPPGSILLR